MPRPRSDLWIGVEGLLDDRLALWLDDWSPFAGRGVRSDSEPRHVDGEPARRQPSPARIRRRACAENGSCGELRQALHRVETYIDSWRRPSRSSEHRTTGRSSAIAPCVHFNSKATSSFPSIRTK